MAGRKVFEPGDVLSANDVNSFLMDQSVMVFASAADRAAQITEPIDGMLTYRTDSKLLQSYNGTAWVGVVPASSNVPAASVVGELTNATIAGSAITGTIPGSAISGTIAGSLITGTISNAEIGTTRVKQVVLTLSAVVNTNVASTQDGVLVITNTQTTNSTISFTDTTDFPIGGRLDIIKTAGSGTLIIRSTTGASIFGGTQASTQYLLANNNACSVLCVGTDSYRIIGNVTAV